MGNDGLGSRCDGDGAGAARQCRDENSGRFDPSAANAGSGGVPHHVQKGVEVLQTIPGSGGTNSSALALNKLVVVRGIAVEVEGYRGFNGMDRRSQH